jgi:hypothetical protein
VHGAEEVIFDILYENEQIDEFSLELFLEVARIKDG